VHKNEMNTQRDIYRYTVLLTMIQIKFAHSKFSSANLSASRNSDSDSGIFYKLNEDIPRVDFLIRLDITQLAKSDSDQLGTRRSCYKSGPS